MNQSQVRCCKMNFLIYSAHVQQTCSQAPFYLIKQKCCRPPQTSSILFKKNCCRPQQTSFCKLKRSKIVIAIKSPQMERYI